MVHPFGFYCKNQFPLKEISPVAEELLDCEEGLLHNLNTPIISMAPLTCP
jgi:hypothetical protein